MGAGEEGISAMRIGMALTFFAAVIVFVLYNVIWGQNIARDFIGQADKAQTQSMNKYFQEALAPEGLKCLHLELTHLLNIILMTSMK